MRVSRFLLTTISLLTCQIIKAQTEPAGSAIIAKIAVKTYTNWPDHTKGWEGSDKAIGECHQIKI